MVLFRWSKYEQTRQVLVKPEFDFEVENFCAMDRERDISDHCPVWLVGEDKNWGPKPFRFNNCWLEHADFRNFVEERWCELQINGLASFILKEKMKKLKDCLKRWNKEVFGVFDLNIDKLVKDMNVMEEAAASGDQIDVERVKSLSAQFWDQLKYKEILLAQKSRVKWIAEGDANTRYFHMCVN